MTLQPGKQANAIHIVPNISRSKGNQRLKFGQLIEYNILQSHHHLQDTADDDFAIC